MLPEFTAKNAQVLGISIDTPADNLLFKDKFAFNFDLLSDEDRSVTLAYGADREDPSKPWPKRITYVIDAEGRIARVYGDVTPAGHAREVLDAL
ncbi:MAG: peroxiredoxin [SAR324 cluster bacterium]|nr:peroxiredoxin [SAR324 cluster bacterium]